MESNEAGQYRVTPLNPGTYTVRAESPGFTAQVLSGVVLQVAAVLEVDFALELGQVTETIEVTGAAPIMQTEEASVGGVVTGQDLQRLPVNQRNYTRLILLMPGTSSVRRSQSRGTGQSGTQLYSVNGGRPQDNNYTLDGFDSNMQMMNSPGISPPMDALQEFKVATNNASEFGRSMGANVSMVIKSGTNELHGTVYEYLRNSAFDANEFFANRNGLGKTPFRLNQYGVAIGGPLPKLQNKMFWFVSWEGFRRRRGSTQNGSVPIADFRAGDFSTLLSGSKPTVITDPFDNGAPFANNVIPQARINPAIPTALELTTPLPNRAGLTQNYLDNQSQANNRDGIHWRYDYNMNEKNTFFFRFSYQNADLLNPDFRPGFVGNSEFDVVNYGGAWTHIFSPTATLEVGFGTNQPNDPGLTTKPFTREDFLSRTGLQMYQRDVFGDPLVNISFGAYGTPGAGGGVTGDNVWQTRANFNWVKGRHSMKIGGQYHYRQFYTNTSNPMNGDASFNGQITGFPMADAWLGFPTEIRRGQGNTLTDGIGHFITGHVQDDWRVNSKLTLNLGLMYQFGSRPYDSTDRLGNLWVRRDEGTGEYFATLMWATENPELAPPDGRMPAPLSAFERGRAANQAGWGRALVGSDYNDFAPRAGIAYKLNDKTVIRTGFGVFYNSTFVQELQDLRKFWPFTVQQVFSPNRGDLAGLLGHRRGSVVRVHRRHRRLAAEPGQSLAVLDAVELLHPAPVCRMTLTLDIGYVGSASRKQIGYSPFNSALTPGPGPIDPRRLLPFFGDLDGGSNQYNGSYNALQVKLNKRYSSGLQFNMNYTWQKALDGQSSLAESQKTQDPFNRRNDYSRSSWDINHVFVFAYVYELPFGRGRQFGGDWGGAANMLLGGWSLEGITRLESGPPVLVRVGRDLANIGRSYLRPNLVGDPNDGPKDIDNWFNANAFEVPAPYTYGTAAPWMTNADGIVGFRHRAAEEV